MTLRPHIRRPHGPGEDGYMLLAVVFLLALLILSLSVALPRVTEDIQRDRDLETMHRGEQYVRAIQLYYRKFHAYPPTIDALVKTNNIRFLRKRYTDPMTGKDDWKPIHFGQNKTPTAMGFFGQPLSQSSLAGTGPGGGNGIVGASTIGGGLNSPQGSGSMFGTPTTTTAGAAPTGTTAGATGAAGATGGTAAGGTAGGTAGETFGGAGIIGVSPASPRQSIFIYKKMNHYNGWEFTYDPLMDRKVISGNTGNVGQSAGSISSGIGGISNGSGSSPSTTAPVSPAAPVNPQQ